MSQGATTLVGKGEEREITITYHFPLTIEQHAGFLRGKKSGLVLNLLEYLVKNRKDNRVLCIHKSKQNNQTVDFLSGPVIKNPPCNAGDAGSIPSRGTKSPHASKQLSPSALEPACHN